jgi:hypothetical protein
MEPVPWMDAAVTVHDEYQIELKLKYPLPKGSAKTSYEVGFEAGTNPLGRLRAEIEALIRRPSNEIPKVLTNREVI